MGKALLVIDVQEGMFNKENPVNKGNELVKTIEDLLEKARSNAVPVYYIQHNAPAGYPLEKGTEAWKIYHAITPKDQDRVIEKTTPDAFHLTNLHDELQINNIHELILTGIQSEVCVDTTCRRAFSLGYDVIVVADAHSTWSTEQLDAEAIIHHHNQTLKWFADVIECNSIKFN